VLDNLGTVVYSLPVKLVSFVAGGRERYGVVSAGGIIDASARLEGAPTLRHLLEQGRLDELDANLDADHALDDVELLLPITEPRKILCAGRNYAGYHEVVEPPEYPSIFGRFASSFSPHRQAIWAPEAGEQLDYEGELVVVIGKAGRHISEDDAFDHIFGYTCMNEGTVRDWMRKGTQNTPAKNFFRSGGLGPWIVTADEVPDPMALHITTRRNGNVVQDGSPGGSAVDGDPPVWLHDGDVIEVEISGVGTLRNPVVDEPVISSRG
jgi:2-keto-4-pentenoate hydratase/2-oxohepta-3-ene-1,7-dioic acid hydratase in catechol pathway